MSENLVDLKGAFADSWTRFVLGLRSEFGIHKTDFGRLEEPGIDSPNETSFEAF